MCALQFGNGNPVGLKGWSYGVCCCDSPNKRRNKVLPEGYPRSRLFNSEIRKEMISLWITRRLFFIQEEI